MLEQVKLPLRPVDTNVPAHIEWTEPDPSEDEDEIEEQIELQDKTTAGVRST